MKPSEIIIKEIEYINECHCNAILKNDKKILIDGEIIGIKNKGGEYAYIGFGSRINEIYFKHEDIYPLFEIEPDKYDDPKILRSVRAAIAGAVVEYYSDKDPDKCTVIEFSDYTPEAEIDQNGIKWRLPPTTKIIQKTIPLHELIRHINKSIADAQKANDEKKVEILKERLDFIIELNEDFPIDDEVSINSPDKDGDLYYYPDKYEEATPLIEQPSTPSSEEPSPIPSREKLSKKSFSDEKEIRSAPSHSSEISEKEKTPVMQI